MKKLTTEECEQIGILTIVRAQKYHMFKIRETWLRLEFNNVLAQRLEAIGLYSLMPNSPLSLSFTTSRLHFGGVRYWFICPNCDKRVGKLFKPKSERAFWCRHCYNLTYKSTQTHNHRVNLLVKRLKAMEDEAFTQVKRLLRTRRGFGVYMKVEEKLNRPFPPPHWVRGDREKEAYNKYIKPLLEG